MKRVGRTRITFARLGWLVLAWHALVLQNLAGGALAARASSLPAALALSLCADAGDHDGLPTPHAHDSCVCALHGFGAATPPPVPHGTRAPRPRIIASLIACANDLPSGPTPCRAPPVRGPPLSSSIA